MARTLQDLLRVTNGVAPDVRKAPSPFDNLPQGVGLKPGGGQPFGIPLSPGALGDKVSSRPGGAPFREMGRFAGGTPRQASSPIADARRTLSAPNPFEAYGGAFGGVNQNDLYRRPPPPAAGPNGMMGPAPTNDFNAMAGSQVGGQGAALAAEAPWRGVFADAWKTANPDEYRQLGAAGARKNPRTGRPMSETNLFGGAPRDANGNLLAPQGFNPDTGMSTGFGPGRDPVSGEYLPGSIDEGGVWHSGSGLGDNYERLSDAELAKLAADPWSQSLGGGWNMDKLRAEQEHRERSAAGKPKKKKKG